MKKVTCFLIQYFVSCLVFCPAQMLTNTGFETWAVDSTGYLNPVDWWTSNGEEIPVPTVLRTAGRTGDFAAKLISVDTGSGIANGYLFYFFNGSLKPLLLSGYWKGAYAPGGAIVASVTTYNSSFDAIAGGILYDSISHSDWVQFYDSVVTYSIENAIQTWILIDLESTSANDVSYIDDLTLTYTTAVGEIKSTPLFSSSLACDSRSDRYLLNFDLSRSEDLEISIYSAEGKKMTGFSRRFGSGHYEIPVAVSGLSGGIYFCRITGEGLNKVYKIVK